MGTSLSILTTIVFLFFVPYAASEKTGVPYMEWTFLVGVIATSFLFYIHGSGYMWNRYSEEVKNTCYRSYSFWIACTYTVISYMLNI
ncbi:hypothetical protein [Anoxybacillus sp. FSL W8-1294]|uniref:hypothetical protein n=1 Tax=Anoxybacillus sp. FSL W8-1294 TaxID=2954655 RepID=UPI0030CB4A97